jgi:hypothetical protein
VGMTAFLCMHTALWSGWQPDLQRWPFYPHPDNNEIIAGYDPSHSVFDQLCFVLNKLYFVFDQRQFDLNKLRLVFDQPRFVLNQLHFVFDQLQFVLNKAGFVFDQLRMALIKLLFCFCGLG